MIELLVWNYPQAVERRTVLMNGQDRLLKEGDSKLTSDHEFLPRFPYHLSRCLLAPVDRSVQNDKGTASLAGSLVMHLPPSPGSSCRAGSWEGRQQQYSDPGPCIPGCSQYRHQ